MQLWAIHWNVHFATSDVVYAMNEIFCDESKRVSLPDFLLDVAVLMDVLGHEVEKLVEADAAVAVLVNLANHFLQFFSILKYLGANSYLFLKYLGANFYLFLKHFGTNFIRF